MSSKCPCGEPATTTPGLCRDCYAERLALIREFASHPHRHALRRRIEVHENLRELQFNDEEDDYT